MSAPQGSSLADILKNAGQAARRDYQQAAEPLLRELASQGLQVESVGELRQRPQDYATAAPILVRWLPLVRYGALKLDILHTLGNFQRIPIVGKALIEEFQRPDEQGQPSVKWSVGDAIEAVADDTLFTDIVRLVRRKEYGKDREMLALALAKTSAARAVPVLLELLDDEDVGGHAVSALRKLRPPEAKTKLERMKNHPRPWVRREVVKALAAIGRGQDTSPKKPELPEIDEPFEMSEASTGFDLELVRPFLKQLSALVSGFGPKQITKVMRTLDEMDVDNERQVRFEVKYDGRTVPLRIGIFMDDEDAPDLHFFTTPELTARIQTAIEDFWKKHEQSAGE